MQDRDKNAADRQVMEALGYTFHDEELLRRALTHPSAGKPDNQRLEFLGDAVLQYLMSDRLYRNHPADREGSLTHMRALLVCEAALSQIAARLGIGDAMVMDRGEEQTGGRTKPSVLCDAMEAVLAAVYLDGGMEAARARKARSAVRCRTARDNCRSCCRKTAGKRRSTGLPEPADRRTTRCSKRRRSAGTGKSAAARGGPRNRLNRRPRWKR